VQLNASSHVFALSKADLVIDGFLFATTTTYFGHLLEILAVIVLDSGHCAFVYRIDGIPNARD